jgi:hypothetical protein
LWCSTSRTVPSDLPDCRLKNRQDAVAGELLARSGLDQREATHAKDLRAAMRLSRPALVGGSLPGSANSIHRRGIPARPRDHFLHQLAVREGRLRFAFLQSASIHPTRGSPLVKRASGAAGAILSPEMQSSMRCECRVQRRARMARTACAPRQAACAAHRCAPSRQREPMEPIAPSPDRLRSHSRGLRNSASNCPRMLT